MAASEHLSLCDVTAATSLRKSFVTPVIRPLLAATDLDRIVGGGGVSVRSLIRCYETTVTTTTTTTAADVSDDDSQAKTTTTTASNTASERSVTAAAVGTTAKSGDVSRAAARRISGHKDFLICEQKWPDVVVLPDLVVSTSSCASDGGDLGGDSSSSAVTGQASEMLQNISTSQQPFSSGSKTSCFRIDQQ